MKNSIASVLVLVGVTACGFPSRCARAQPPAVDIVVARLVESVDSIVVGDARNVTFRRGYDNQPSFSPDGGLMWYVAMDSTGQSDVWRWSAEADSTVRVTRTPESEFSPQLMPDERALSVVRVESDGTQRLWAFSLDGSNPRLLITGVDSVGYYAWADANTVALFIVGSPHSLRLVDLREPDEILIARDVGRSIHRIPGSDGSISFFARHEETWGLTELMRPSLATRRFFDAPRGSLDCAWTPAGRVLMGAAERIVARRPGDRRWVEIARSLEGPVTRIAVSATGGRIAWVVPDRGAR